MADSAPPEDAQFSTQVIVDFDRREDGAWEVVARFGPEDQISAWEIDALTDIGCALGESLIAAVLDYSVSNATVNYGEALQVARDLIGDSDGTNPEYTRAMCELIGDLWGKPGVELGDRKMEVAHVLGVKF